MRGDNLTAQPFIRGGNVFLWNGEVFDGLEVRSDFISLPRTSLSSLSLTHMLALQVSPHENDGQKLFDQIQQYGPSHFFAAIRDVEGPYAFVYFEASTDRIYFARDPLGRRSLLFHLPTPDSPSFLLASTAPGGDSLLREWTEVATDAVHCIDLRGSDPLSPVRALSLSLGLSLSSARAVRTDSGGLCSFMASLTSRQCLVGPRARATSRTTRSCAPAL